jgi:H+/Cl- antiporter ClcA
MLFAAGIIVIHMLAVELSLYWTYRGVDVPMHILGGIMAGFFTLVSLQSLKLKETLLYTLMGVLAVGVGWELLELLYRVDTLNFRYWVDTVKDLINDTIGGLIAIYIWKKIPNQK